MEHFSRGMSAFTLIELLVVVAVLAILFIVVLLVLNPAQLLMQARDSNRLQDLADIADALNLFSEDVGSSLGSGNTVYVSLPDPAATSTAGDACQGLSLLALPTGYAYHCAASSTYRSISGTGWLPVSLASISVGSPLSELPIDPTNTSSSRLYYTYATNGSQYELTASMESQKYGVGGSNDVISDDGGMLATVYEKGTAFGLEPLDYGDSALVGWWPLDEGTGTVAYDGSGNNATGSWHGSQIGTNGYYYAPGKVGAYAGDFDGSTNYVAINSTNYPTSNNPVSVTAWINPTVVSQDDAIVGWGSGSTDGPTFMIVANAHLYLNVNGGSYSPQSSFVIPANSWSFVGITYTGGTSITFYLNGQSNTVNEGGAILTNVASGQARIGCAAVAACWPFPGLIDDVRIYNRALSAAQIAAIYNAEK